MNLYEATREAYQYSVDNSSNSDFAKNAKMHLKGLIINMGYERMESNLQQNRLSTLSRSQVR